MSSATQDGYPAFYIPSTVTSFTGYGMGSYSFFNQGVSIENAMAFQGIESVINGTGTAVSSSFGGPSDVVSYP
jgi:hypothetical protein